MDYFYKLMKSPVGILTLVAGEKGLSAVIWENDKPGRERPAEMVEDRHFPVLLEAEQQLNNYFVGKLRKFSLLLDFNGTEFQKKVYSALAAIPFGQTRSYGQIALEIDHPKAVRAVGAASGKNPISIIVPCHRVIGSKGNLVGFGGGLATKAFLLGMEREWMNFEL